MDGTANEVGAAARAALQRAAVTFGHTWRISRYAPVGPAGDCWTHAWEQARAYGWDYCEGVAARGGDRYATHAWCLDRSGMLTADGTVVEVTTGYGDSVAWVGFLVNRDHPHVQEADRIMRGTPLFPRSSVVETMLGAGVPFDVLMRDGVVRLPG